MKIRFELEDDLWWKAETVLSFWKGFQSRKGDYGAQDSDLPSNGSVDIVFAPEGRDTTPLTDDETVLIEWFLKNNSQVSEASLSSVFETYPVLQTEYSYSLEERAEFMPDIKERKDLRNLIGLHTVYIHQITKNGVPYIGFEFGCTWDPEHGIGVLMNGVRTVKIGGADTALLLWIAEKDAKMP